jgi:hypothetical protein
MIFVPEPFLEDDQGGRRFGGLDFSVDRRPVGLAPPPDGLMVRRT